MHASGKHEVAKKLESMGVKYGKLFTNLTFDTDTPGVNKNIYNKDNFEYYDIKDVCDIFENNAYIFLQHLPGVFSVVSSIQWFEGLSKYTFDNNDVFVISPDQLMSIPPTTINEPVCFIWMDNTKNNRKTRYFAEKRDYNFKDREDIERKDINSFVKSLYSFNNSNVLYFTDEEPERVATIIYSLIKHPDLLPIYVKSFN